MFKMLLAVILFVSSYAFCEPETFESSPTKQKVSMGFKLQKGWHKQVKFRSALAALTLPRHFDWREQGQLSPIKNQGDCGSCWSFSTVATLQDAIALKNKTIVDLSEQYLVSCNTRGWGCNGGDFAHDMHVSPGSVYTKDFPYAAKALACKPNLAYQYKVDSWAYLPSKSENDPPGVDEIKAAIYQFGPISAAVAASDKFVAYRSGVFNSCDTTTEVNHAINLVGWDDDGQYWILRNSWSSSWGINGWMNIKWNCNKVGIASNYIMFHRDGKFYLLLPSVLWQQ